jgi:Fe-S-cluster containining protein
VGKKKKKKKEKLGFDCSQCMGYCCSYDEIPVTDKDLTRLATHFSLTEEQMEKKYMKKAKDGSRIMRHKKDHFFDSTCIMFDQEERRCTVYDARMKICRRFPDDNYCGYYEFMMWERENQDDDEFSPQVI